MVKSFLLEIYKLMTAWQKQLHGVLHLTQHSLQNKYNVHANKQTDDLADKQCSKDVFKTQS